MKSTQQELESPVLRKKKKQEDKRDKGAITDMKTEIKESTEETEPYLKSLNHATFCKWFKRLLNFQICYDVISIILVVYIFVQVHNKPMEVALNQNQGQGQGPKKGDGLRVPLFMTSLSFGLVDAVACLLLFDFREDKIDVLGLGIMGMGKLSILTSSAMLYFLGFAFGTEWETECWRNSIVFGITGQLIYVLGLTGIFIAAYITHRNE